MHNSIDKAAFNEYHLNKLHKSECLYKAFIITLITIISIFFIFIIIIQFQITTLNSQSNSLSISITTKSSNNIHINIALNRKLVNLSSSLWSNLKFKIDTINSIEEFNSITKWFGFNEPRIKFCYKGTYDFDYDGAFEDYCSGMDNLLFIIKTESRHRFGAVIFSEFHDVGTVYEDSKAFLFSLDTGKRFNINNSSKAFTHKGDKGFIQFGDNDLIIAENYWLNRNSYSQFPMDYGVKNQDKLNDLTGGESSFRIVELEVFYIYTLSS